MTGQKARSSVSKSVRFNVPLRIIGISETILQAITCTCTDNKNEQQNQSNQHQKTKIQKYTTYVHMHTNVILTNERRTHAQSKYTNTKLKDQRSGGRPHNMSAPGRRIFLVQQFTFVVGMREASGGDPGYLK